MVAAARVVAAEFWRAHVAQQAEHFLGKEEVSGSIPDVGSTSARGGHMARCVVLEA